MSLLIDYDTASVTIGGTAYPLASFTVVESLAPEVESADITVPWGDRLIRGAAAPSETLPARDAAVVITCGSWTWRGRVIARHRVGTGASRSLRIRAVGPGLAMERAYLPSFARSGLSGVVQAPGGPRFAPGTRSATADGPGTTYRLGGTGSWTVAQALAAYVKHATDYAGLPAITIDSGTATLTRELSDLDTDGGSVHAGIAEIIGHRTGLAWRAQEQAGGWYLRIYDLSGTGVAVTLTAGDVLDYDVGEDWSAALADLEVRGPRKQYVYSIDGKASGDLTSDWDSGDVSDREAGDRSSPAFRRFTIANHALPDGSPSVTADPVPTLPIAAEGTLAAGSSPWLLFAQLTSDDSWISLQGQVSISVAGSTRIWIEGITPEMWALYSRLRLTLCMSPRAHLTQTKTGGDGIGRGLSIVACRHAYASSAAVRVSGSSLATVTGTVASEQDPIDDQADALWSELSGKQIVASWTRATFTGPDVGDRVTSFVLPVPGSSSTTVTCDAICTSRTTTVAGGVVRRSWSVVPRPFASEALTRE
jgi:hypothetical protein